MNLPVELQRRLDRRWSARFEMPEQGSGRSAVAHPRSKPNLWADLPDGAGCVLMGHGTALADHPDRSTRTHPLPNPPLCGMPSRKQEVSVG
jgi:hypothetical protein